ncbi:unnamed protein product [Porites evermanni]|uniref:Uncharacterized protein n=1 Tax=Porites evermanni TaxID=104178 RepID=A0ABN8REE4_9CNID|nr:unnamed protein product [Porites evermanni]
MMSYFIQRMPCTRSYPMTKDNFMLSGVVIELTQAAVSHSTPFILQEINELLHPLMNAAAHNVHMACPEIHRALKSVEVDVSGRKSSMQEKPN